MMARCGRPELDSCPRVVGCGAPARKRRRLVLAPPKISRNPPPETTATQNTRANSQKPKQPTAWTAWKPSLQKIGTAKEPTAKQPRAQRARLQEQPTAWLAAPPRNARQAARTAWKPSLQKAATADEAKVQTVAGGGDPGCGLSEPGYRTADSRNSGGGGLRAFSSNALVAEAFSDKLPRAFLVRGGGQLMGNFLKPG